MGRNESNNASDYYPNGASNELPEHDATVAAFALDKYEVTVSRFREFVRNYDAWRTSHPSNGEGSNANAANTGWGQSWAVVAGNLPATAADLKIAIACDAAFQNWTDTIGSDAAETYPINCIDWFTAFAFCVWDGGRLPTEAEWEYAAAGGAQNRLHPWGLAWPNADLVNFNGSEGSSKVVVGSKLKTGGGSYFGHADLAGSAYEWVFDWYSDGYYGTLGSPAPCNNCANSATADARIIRGGAYSYTGSELRSARRSGFTPALRDDLFGMRCARPTK